MIPFIVAGVAILVGATTGTYAYDQRNKRVRAEQEADELREKVRRLEKQLEQKETQLVRLRVSHSEKNEIVRNLIAEIEHLRAELEAMRKAA